MNDLVICQTPFQLVLARSIMKGRSNYELLVVCEKGTTIEKMDYYIDFFKRNEIKVSILKINNRGFYAIKSFLMIRKLLRKKINISYNCIYLAGVHNIYIHKIMSMLEFNKIITFDDGVGNINKKGVFFLEKRSFKYRLIESLFNIKYSLSRIKKETVCHYTIYKGIENVFDKCEYIDIFGLEKNILYNSKSFVNEISFFIGQPLESLKTNINYIQVENFIKLNSIDFYYPHPRENSSLKCNKVNTLLIAEEYILNLLKENPTLKIKLYGFFSSTILNLTSLSCVDVVVLYDDIMMKEYGYLYSIIESMGGQVIMLKDSVNVES